MNSKSVQKQDNDRKKAIAVILTSTLYSLLTAIPLMLIFSALLMKISKYENYFNAVNILIYLFSAFVGGFACVKRLKSKAMLFAALSSLLLCLEIFGISLAMRNDLVTGNSMYIRLFLVIIFYLAGGFFAGTKTSTKKKKSPFSKAKR